MFYLVKYLKKEAGSPNSALAILIDARDHINEYGSQGPDANTPQHFARHLLSRCVNKSDQELSGTQSASVVLGFPSFGCSDIYGYVDNHCAWKTADELWRASANASSSEEGTESDEADNDADERGPSKPKTDFDEVQNARAFDSDDDESANEDARPSSKMYSIPQQGSALNMAVAISQSMNYQFRGQALKQLNFVEYSNMVTIEKYKEKPCAALGSGPGRKGSKCFDFDHGHPLCKHFVQKIREKFIIPIRAGGARPRFPQPLEEGKRPSAAWVKQHDRAAAFYSSNFAPWSDLQIPDLRPSQFRLWVFEQHRISEDPENRTFAERLIARGRLQEFRNYAFLNQLGKDDLQINRQHRQRNRRRWTDEEIDNYITLCGGAAGKKKVEDEVENLRKRQEARKTNVRRLEIAERNQDWVDGLTSHASSLFGGEKKLDARAPSLAALRSSLCLSHRSPTVDEVKQSAENLYTKISPDDVEDSISGRATASPFHAFDLDAANEVSELPYSFDLIDQCKYPKELERISDDDFIAAKREWDRLYKDSYKNNVAGTPRPPSNPEQRELARCVLRQVRAARNLQSTNSATNALAAEEMILTSDPAPANDAANENDDIGFMVVGAPGVGKSHSVSTISFYVKHENLGTVLSSAYTGVATIQVFTLRVCYLEAYSFFFFFFLSLRPCTSHFSLVPAAVSSSHAMLAVRHPWFQNNYGT